MSLTSLFLLSFFASTLLPGGSEVYLSYLILNSNYSGFILVAIATIGNSMGGMTNWLLGRFVKHYFYQKKAENRHLKKAQTWIERWGAPILLLSWLPIIGDPLCVVAGFFRVNWLKSLFYILMGKLARYIAIFYLLN